MLTVPTIKWKTIAKIETMKFLFEINFLFFCYVDVYATRCRACVEVADLFIYNLQKVNIRRFYKFYTYLLKKN